MDLVIIVIGAILAVFIVILLHEAGHFLVAKIFRVKVLRFSIGFGKYLASWVSKSGTEYVLAILPLGGYVKMLDDREIHVSKEDAKHAFNRQPLLVRMAIVIAGPVTNFILAVVAFWIVFLLGVTYIKPVVGKVTPGSMAEIAGFQAGDRLVQIEGHPIQGWQQVITYFITHMGNKRKLIVVCESAHAGGLQTHQFSLQNWKLQGEQPDILGSMGIVPYQPDFPAIVAKTLINSPAARNGLQSGDQILGFNQETTTDWPTLSDYIHHHPDQEITLKIKQNDQIRQLNVQLASKIKRGQRTGFFGVEVKPPDWPPSMVENAHYSIITAWSPSWRQAWDLTIFNAIVLGKMILGKISMQSLGGPITIFRSAGEASSAGLQAYLGFIGFVSVTLAFINILPIPGLDGGHFLFQVIEGIMRRPIPEKYQTLLLKIGIVLIILLIIQGTINDIVRLFVGGNSR